MGSRVERTHGKVAAGRPSKVVDCGAGWAKLQLAEWAVPHSIVEKLEGTTGEQGRPHNPGLQLREIKPQTTD